MIIGLGVDVLEVSRMERALREGDPDLAHDLFTPAEIAECPQPRQLARYFAGRFAAKEAILKALALDGSEGTDWHEVELRLADARAPDRPRVILHGVLKALADRKRVIRILVSISHARSLAMAAAVLECRDD